MNLNPFIAFVLLNPRDEERESEEARGLRSGGGGLPEGICKDWKIEKIGGKHRKS